MAAFGKDYCNDYDVVYQMGRERLIESLLSIVSENKALKFDRQFLDGYCTCKLRHIMWDAVEETFWPQWEKELKRIMRNECACCGCSESSGD